MKQLLQIHRNLLLPAAVLLGITCAAAAQTSPIIPIPFVSNFAGVAPGGNNTACTNGIPNTANPPVNLGDGCIATQATLTTLYDTAVDPQGNLYFTESATNFDLRVVYNGGTQLAQALIAANPQIVNFIPLPGRVYTLAGGPVTGLTAVNGVYYCGNVTGGIQAIDTMGNGCPGAYSWVEPKGIAIDQYGNVFMSNAAKYSSVRVLYFGGAQVANLITMAYAKTATPVPNPKVGYIYQIGGGNATKGVFGDGGPAWSAGLLVPRYIAVDSGGNIYVSDATGTSVVSGVTITASGANVREINGTTGIINTVAGENTCGQTTYNANNGCPYGYSGDGGPATSALFNLPYELWLDSSNNLFILDSTNARVRVVYRGGTIAGISNPVVGNVYTYAGGGASTVNGTTAQSVLFASVKAGGIDRSGNIYVLDPTNNDIWKFDAITAIGNVIAGPGTSTGSAKNGAYCNKGTTGPKSIDNNGDGCPATEAYTTGQGHITFDQAGNFWIAPSTAEIQKFSYNTQFGSTPDGTPVSQPLAFEDITATTLTSESFTLQSSTSTEFSDAGGDTCTTMGALAAKTLCVFNVSFTPAHPGVRTGTLQLNNAIANTVENITGTGLASDLAIDTGTPSTLGTGLTPTGVAADLLGNVYVADSKAGQVLKGASTGTTLTPLITGLKNPSQVAIDNVGDIYVADTGNNRILITTPAGATITSVSAGLSGPQGVVADGFGNVYVADTGNNRIVKISQNGYENVFPLAGLVTPLSAPTQLALDGAGDLFIVDLGGGRIVEYVFSTGVVGPLTLDAGVIPNSVAVDQAGDVYLTTTASSYESLSILEYPVGVTAGNLLQSGTLATPVGIAVDADANVFVADTNNGALELRRSLGDITFPLTNLGTTTQASITLSNVGTAALTFPSLPLLTQTGSTLFTVVPATANGCGAGISYALGQGCNFTASFSPTVAVTATATDVFNTNAANTGTAKAVLNAVGKYLVPTTTTATVSPAGTLYYSQQVILTVTVTPSTTTVTPSGTFIFTVDGKQQPSENIGSGTYKLVLNLGVGTHIVTSTYSGDTNYASSATSTTIVILPATTTTVINVMPVNNNGLVTLVFTATVTVNGNTATGQTGTVNFYAGTQVLNTQPIAISLNTTTNTYTATYTTSTLNYASYVFTAAYSGSTNGNFLGSTSAPFVTGGGDFSVGSTSPTFSVPQGGIGQIEVTLASIYGGAGTITATCSGLPANSNCRFLPVQVTVGPTPVALLAEIYTNAPSNLASNGSDIVARGISFAIGFPLALGLLLRRRRAKLGMLAMLVLGVAFITGLSGCNSASIDTMSGLTTPTGTYTVTFVFTGSNGLTTTHTAVTTFTVLPAEN